jgi:hypothetical protein
MSELRCQYSGVPIHVVRPLPGRDYFSCTGCFLASRIRIDEKGNFPITRTLLAVLAGGLLFFNQALFWLLSVLLAGQGRTIVSKRFLVASLALGVALWLVLAVTQSRATGGGCRMDRLVVALTGGLAALGVWLASPGCVLGAVFLLGAWGSRGVKRRRESVPSPE